MKSKFGKALFSSTLTQGLYPLGSDPDTLEFQFSLEFSFFEGVSHTDTASASLPSILSASLTQVVQYVADDFDSTSASQLPTILSASLTQVVFYVADDFDSTSAAPLPTILSASLTQVVRVHTLYDYAAVRPEDTLQHTFNLEFS